MSRTPGSRSLSASFWMLLSTALSSAPSLGQTSQGVILGTVIDSTTGRPIANATVTLSDLVSGHGGSVITGVAGRFEFLLLSPNVYRVVAEAAGYQRQELSDVRLDTASYVSAHFKLRAIGDLWERGQYRSVLSPGRLGVVTMVGPDLDRSRAIAFMSAGIPRGGMEAAVSTVVPDSILLGLPLSGRDTYTLLVTHAGVTSDSGTARGLGLSANGQRPSATNLLLDGVENNNYVTTGPLIALPPEAIGEYRVSSAGFSAEYGRATGLIANAITRSGGNDFHTLLYHYGKNEALNANEFQRNRQFLARAKVREFQPGFVATGPVRKNRLFGSASVEHFQTSGTGDRVTLPMPTAAGFRRLSLPSRIAYKLLEPNSGLLPSASDGRLIQDVNFDPPRSLARFSGLVRADHISRGGKQRTMWRAHSSVTERPDFVWTPYPGYSSTLGQTAWGVMAGHTGRLVGGSMSEFRLSLSRDWLEWDRPKPEVPTLAAPNVWLPGSPAFYGYRNASTGLQAENNLLFTRGSHMFKLGGGALARVLDGRLTAGKDARVHFSSLIGFYADAPSSVDVAVVRGLGAGSAPPQFERSYRSVQWNLFVQDNWRAYPGLTANFGLRYDSMGSPTGRGLARDVLVELDGEDGGLARPSRARLVQPGNRNRLYAPDRNDWATRLGVSFSPGEAGRTLFSAAFGIFYDRPFDNLWQNVRSNGVELFEFELPFVPDTNYIAVDPGRLAATAVTPLRFPEVLSIANGLRSPQVRSTFFRVEREIGGSLVFEGSFWTSFGRGLIATDRFNRVGELNRDLPVVVARSNLGRSTYRALAVAAKTRGSRTNVRIAYTLARGMDNQSDPLAGDFFDLAFSRNNFSGDRPGIAAFSRAGDTNIDWGRADFDQLHNLTLHVLADLPGALRGWSVGGLAAARSGFPYSVLATPQASFDAVIYNQRARLAASGFRADAPAAGGRVLLNRSAFAEPGPFQFHGSERNVFRGPGLVSADISVARTFRFSERLRFTLRVDAFNFLNHVNLNPPETQLASPDFGLALFGRKGRGAGFPALVPFDETARRLQILLRFSL